MSTFIVSTDSPSAPDAVMGDRMPDKADSSMPKSPRRAKRESQHPSLDDFSLLLQHEDFAAVVSLAAQVKQGRQKYHTGVSGSNMMTASHSPTQKPSHSGAPLQADEVLGVVASLQVKLLNGMPQIICRGAHPMTDILMDDILQTLRRELKVIAQHLKLATSPAIAMAPSLELSPVTSRSVPNMNILSPDNIKSASPRTPKSTKSSTSSMPPIATKYTKQQTDILMKWMIHNVHQPFPSNADISSLMQQTGLSHSQVVNWTTNVRKRNRKATCEQRKKPHHFLDFLFLKQHHMNQHANATKATFGAGSDSGVLETVKSGGAPFETEYPYQELREAPERPQTKTSFTAAGCNRAGHRFSSFLPSFRSMAKKKHMDEDCIDSNMWEPIQDVSIHGDDSNDNKELLNNFADFWFGDEHNAVSSSCSHGACDICYHHGTTMTPAPSQTKSFTFGGNHGLSSPLVPTPNYSSVSPTSHLYVQPQLIPPSVTSDSHDYEATSHWSFSPSLSISATNDYATFSSPPPMMMIMMPSEIDDDFAHEDDEKSTFDDDLCKWAEDMGLMMDAL